jgi:hypothetical protein
VSAPLTIRWDESMGCYRVSEPNFAADGPVRVFREEDHDAVTASARVLRVICDPLMQADGCDPWIVGSTFDGDIERAHVDRIVDMLIKEGHIERRGGRLYAVPYEDEPR